MRWLRALLWSLVASALLGVAIGTWIRLRLEAPKYYIGMESSAAAPRPFDVVHARATVFDARDHEEQVG